MNPLSKSACGFFFALMDRFKLVWRFIVKCAVGSLSVVELNVGINTFYKLLLRCVLCTINLFPLHRRKKGFHDSVIMRLPRLRKRLDNLVHP